MTLPSNEQFLTANFHLNRACDSALLVHWTKDDYHKSECLKRFQEAAEALGLELVERIPNSSREVA